MANSTEDRVGLGVDLMGGPEVLATLRAIRAEMTAIAQLTGRGRIASGTGDIYGPGATARHEQDLRAREKAEMDSIKRTSQRKAQAFRDITNEEVKTEAQAITRRKALRERANAEILRQEREKNDRLDQEARRAQERINQRLRNTQNTRERIATHLQDPTLLGRDLAAQRRIMQRYRRDPARDDVTNQMRRDVAAQVVAQRQLRRERDRLEREDALENRRRAARRLTELHRTDPSLLGQDLGAQRRLLQRYRNDPARDELTNWFRRDTAARIRAQRQLRREERQAEEADFREAQRVAKNRAAYFRRDQDIRLVARNQTRTKSSAWDNPIYRQQQIGAWAAEGFAEQARITRGMSAVQQNLNRMHSTLLPQAKTLTGEFIRLSQSTTQYIESVQKASKPQDITRASQAWGQDYRQRRRDLENRWTELRAANMRLGGTEPQVRRGPGGGGPGGPRLNDPTGLMNDRGFFTSADAVGRITRNILLYQAVATISYGLVDYTRNALNAAKATVEYANALRFATEQGGGNVAQNQRLADSMLNIGLSRQQGRAAVVEAARFAEERPEDVAPLVRVVSNIAAARGLGIERTDELIEQLRRRESKFYKRIFGTTVENIYEQEAARIVGQQSVNAVNNPELYIGIKPTEIKSRTEAIKSYVASMDDAAKENAVLNYILQQGARFEGEAAERANTLAGRMDKLSAAWLNSQEGLGLFITDLKVVSDLMDYLTGKVGVLDRLRPAELGRTGPKGTISEFDLQQYGIDATTGTRYEAKSFIDRWGGTAVTGALGLGALGLLGRRQAQGQFRLSQYNQMLGPLTQQLGSTEAASAEAARRAREMRTGLVRSVGAGMQRITIGMTNAIASATGAPLVNQQAFRMPIYYGNVGPAAGQGVQGPYSMLPTSTAMQRAGMINTTANVAGGLAGGVIGAGIASIVANQITSNSIVATGITIAGGIAGTAIGTALGEAGGTALAARYLPAAGSISGVLGAAGIGAVGSVALASALPLILATQRLTDPTDSIRQLERETAIATMYPRLIREQRERARRLEEQAPVNIEAARASVGNIANLFLRSGESADALTFRSRTGTGGLTTREFDPTELLSRVRGQINTARTELQILNEVSPDDTERIEEKQRALARLEGFQARITTLVQQEAQFRQYGTLDAKRIAEIDDYRARAAERELQRKQKEQEARDKSVTEMSNALNKLRDAAQGSFRLVGDIGTSLAGEDNQYVKVLADQITLGQRMAQQWGFLGEAAVDYFSKVEQRNIDRQLNRLDFATYTTATNLRGQAEREAAERSGPGISRREQDYLNIQEQIVNRAREIPNLWRQAAEVLGQTMTPTQELAGRLTLLYRAFGVQGPAQRNLLGQDVSRRDTLRRNIYGQVLGDMFEVETRRNIWGQSLEDPAIARMFETVGTGLSPEAQRTVQQNYAREILGAFSGYSPEQIRASGYQDLYLGAIRTQQIGLGYGIEDAVRKAQFGAEEDARLARQLRADEEFRRAQLAAGFDPGDVGREADALLLSRTEGISPKDLSYDTFRDRQEALRRNAERAERDRQEAKEAVNKGLEYQASMMETLDVIREAILSGDLSMLIQVQNDTQARIDQEALQNISQGNVPLDQGGVKSNPYTDEFARYGRGGRRR